MYEKRLFFRHNLKYSITNLSVMDICNSAALGFMKIFPHGHDSKTTTESTTPPSRNGNLFNSFNGNGKRPTT